MKFIKILFGILVLAGIGFLVWKYVGKKQDVATFQEVKVTRGDLEATVLANGVVQPQNRLEIKPPIAGRVESIMVDEGYKIQKGQILAWMSSSERAALLDAARAKGSQELAHWEELFKPTPLIAPLTGMLIVRNVEPGQVVTASDPVLVMSDHLIIRVQVDETDIARVKIGSPASIHLEAYPAEKIVGKVDRISFESKVVNNVTIYEVDVLPDTVPEFMRSGMTAEVQFQVTRKEHVLLLPSSAIKRSGGKASVEIYDPEKPGKTVKQEIELGVSDGKFVEVTGGLQEGDTVLVAQYRRPSESDQPSSPLNPMPRGRPR